MPLQVNKLQNDDVPIKIDKLKKAGRASPSLYRRWPSPPLIPKDQSNDQEATAIQN